MCRSTSYWTSCPTCDRRTVWCSSWRCAEAGALLGRCPDGVRRQSIVTPLTARCKRCETDDARRRLILGSFASSASALPDTPFSERPTVAAADDSVDDVDDDDDRDWVLLGSEVLNVGPGEEAVQPSSSQGRTVVRGGRVRAWLRQNAPWRPDTAGSS